MFRVDFTSVLGPGDLVRLVVFDVCAVGVVYLAGLRGGAVLSGVFGLEENVFRSLTRRPILLCSMRWREGSEGRETALRSGGCVVGKPV
jgi:hypothetical protein